LSFLQANPPGNALDLGCGTGTNVITIARHGWQVTGIDFVPRAVGQARRKARQAGVQADIRVGDVTRLDDLTGPFDLILDLGCFHSLDPAGRKAYLRNIQRLLASRGVYLLYAFFAGPNSSIPGITAEDVRAITSQLKLESRQDGSDSRRGRPSAWFILRKAAVDG
jgi:cyclopropane fatty-acyl-phospholipid synthase-like methyltransferase